MNRKLIRPNLTEVKTRDARIAGGKMRESRDGDGAAATAAAPKRPVAAAASTPKTALNNDGDSFAPSGAKPRRVPPTETNAEIFYYKKQIDSHTLMVIVLTDGEEIEGTIEWYDRHALKINRRDQPNILLLKHNIKYMYKAEDRAE